MKSNFVKLALIALLAVALFVPVVMIQNLVGERQARRNEAVAGIAEGWGTRQTVAGPYVSVPYQRSWTEVTSEVVDGKSRERRNERTEYQALRLPAENVQWSVVANVGEKYRGSYKARLYGAKP